MKKKLSKTAELSWVLAIILCSLNVALCANSGFGVSMVVAPAYILHLKISEFLPWFSFGMAEYCLQGVLLIGCCIIMKRFKWKYLLSFGTAVIYGLCVDGWRFLLGTEVYDAMWQRWLALFGSMIICGISIALFLRTYLPQEAYDLFVKEIHEKTKGSLTKIKWCYDIGSLLISIALMLLLFRRFSFDMIGVGTLIITLLNTPLIALSGKILDKFVTFDSAFPKFHEKFEKFFN